ncbi:hypothetical protein LY71_11236 [Geodermatophilus tzadiensis]|uniref:Uncharacterized protein n=1 Tax=Geodermatophilus tzadiensis TaxID=1137988 RepID=A0A2T0TPX8_9ACTN|nr:hypothetical protein LY71_11236 [Geodermatophilus tzadiensis]
MDGARSGGTAEATPAPHRPAAEQPLPRRPVTDPRQRAVPPRPPVTSDVAPPGPPPVPCRPRAVRVAALLCWAGALAAVLGLLAALLDREALDARLTATASSGDPAATAAEVADAVAVTVALVVGAVGLGVALTAGAAALAVRRRSWARWLLLVVLLPTLLALDVAQSTVAGDADLDRVALVVAAGCLLLVPVPLFLRSARAWYRAR